MTMSLFLSILVFLLLGGTCKALIIPDNIKDVVTFIFIFGNDGKIISFGTGFFVGVKEPTKPEKFFGYIVTAKHVIQKGKDGAFVEDLTIRVNKKNGGVEHIRFPVITEGEK
jgi:hypothetical protein